MIRRGAAALVVASALASASLVLGSAGCNHVYEFDDPDAPVATGCNLTGCPLASLYCDPSSGRCEACVEDSNCTGKMHRCDTALHQCFECLVPNDCGVLGVNNTCVENQCVHTCPASPCDMDERCEPSLGLCLHCRSDGDCPATAREHICDVATGRCVECYRDTHCSATPERPHCDPAIEHCVQCVRAADCPAAAPVCDPARGQCVTG